MKRNLDRYFLWLIGNRKTVITATVVVLAVGISGAQSMKNPVAAREIYDGGTQNVLKAAKKSKVGRVVLLSSLAVYGVSGSKSLISESDPLRPPTEYGKILLEAERTAQRLCDGAPPLLILRSAGVFGPNRMGMGSHSARFFERLLYSASLQNPIQLIGSWKDSDDYIYVKDVGRGIALAAKVPLHEPVTVLNLGTGRATTLREVVNILRTMFPTCQISADRMENAPPSRRKPLDCQRIRLFLGFKPEFSMPAALDDYAAEVDLQRKDPCASQQAK